MPASSDAPTLDALPDLLTVPEVAIFLRIGRGKAYLLVRSGAVPSLTLGRSLRIPKQALEHMIENAGSVAGSDE